MNYELYQKKYQYERLINVLQNNYNNLNDVYYSLISCRKIIKESIEIDGVYYNKKTLDNMIKKIEDYRSLIINTFINLCIMTVFAVMTGTHFEQESYVLILYFLVPFMITNVANILTMRLLKNKSNEIVNMTIMLLINAILFKINIKFPSVYETSSVLVWLGLLIITVFYFIKAVYQFYEEEDDYIWNLQ